MPALNPQKKPKRPSTLKPAAKRSTVQTHDAIANSIEVSQNKECLLVSVQEQVLISPSELAPAQKCSDKDAFDNTDIAIFLATDNTKIEEDNNTEENVEEDGRKSSESVQQNQEELVCIHMCAHRMGNTPCIASLVFVGSVVEIRFTDTSGKLYSLPSPTGNPAIAQCARIGLVHVSAMYDSYVKESTGDIYGDHTPSASFWRALACSVEVGPPVSTAFRARTQSVVRFAPVFCRDRSPGLLLREMTRTVTRNKYKHFTSITGDLTDIADDIRCEQDEYEEVTETWVVRHVAHELEPFDLEIEVKLSALSEHSMFYVVPSAYIREQWAHCLGINLIPTREQRYEPSRAPVPQESSLLAILTEQIVVSQDESGINSIFIPSVEKLKLMHYARTFDEEKHSLVRDRRIRRPAQDTQLSRAEERTVQELTSAHNSRDRHINQREMYMQAMDRERRLNAFQSRLQARWKQAPVDEKDIEYCKRVDYARLQLQEMQLATHASSDSESEINESHINLQPKSALSDGCVSDLKEEHSELWNGGDLATTAEVLLDAPNPFIYPTPHDVRVLCASLMVPTKQARSAVQRDAIEAFLLFSELGRGDHLSQCTRDEIMQLTTACTLKKLSPSRGSKEVLAIAQETITHAFVIIQGTVLVGHTKTGLPLQSRTVGDVLGIEALLAAATAWHKDAIVQGPNTLGTRQSSMSDECYGGGNPTPRQQLKSKESAAEESQTLLLAVPLSVLLATCGQSGPEAPEALDCFWKFSRMYKHLLQPDFEPIFADQEMLRVQALYEQECQDFLQDRQDWERERDELDGTHAFIGNDGKSDYVPNRRPVGSTTLTSTLRQLSAAGTPVAKLLHAPNALLATASIASRMFPVRPLGCDRSARRPNVIASARRRHINAGQAIAIQGLPRKHMFLIMSGEAAVLRRVPLADTVGCGAGLVPPLSSSINLLAEQNIGLKLLAGDFWFCDGESEDWCTQRRAEVDADQIVYPEAVLYTERGLQRPLYDTHRHTLFAVTPVEVAVINLAEIAKSVDLFLSLLIESNRRYPVLQRSALGQPHLVGSIEHLSTSSLWNKANVHSQTRTRTNSHARDRIAFEMYKAGLPSRLWPPPTPAPTTQAQARHEQILREATTSEYPIKPLSLKPSRSQNQPRARPNGAQSSPRSK